MLDTLVVRAVRPVGAMLVSVTLAVTVAVGTAASAAAAPQQVKVSAGAVAAQQFGVSMPDVPGTMQPLRDLTASLGRAPDLVMWYAAWSDVASFPATQAANVAATGATPVITWEPWNPAHGVNQPAYALKRIASGAFDSYVSTWARQIKSYGKPVVIRFAHEMNGSWYPWSAQANGNTAADYLAAWKQVRALFTKAKATNVTWLWSPNVPYPGSTPLSAVYPGDASVDQIALDGYNWADLQAGSSWQSFWDVFAQGVGEVRTLTAKPLYVGEVGCPEAGGDKAAWVSDMFATLAAHPEIRGFTWFDFAKEADWRIDSSASSLDAFRTGLATY